MTASVSLPKKIRYTLELVKFSHSLFALPFALSAFLVASRGHFSFKTLLWVVLCVVLARTAAMAFNRLADARFDGENPRTQNRHIPAGLLSKSYVTTLTVVSGVGFILAASQFNRLSLWLSPLCLAVLFAYSLAKRFTDYTQIILGFCLGMAPIGAVIAATGRITMASMILATAVQFWVAGFDLLYALQDLDFDRSKGLRSLPVKIGFLKTFSLSAGFHLVFWALLALYGWMEGMGLYYWIGWALSGAILAWEHRTIREDLRKVNAAFFTANGLLSVFFLIFVAVDLYF
ncbi:MAG: putative 4-hydroxybenzoate polyprenyltransferase [Deltaproteobacteria bacterium]|nr:putative 4-hydroxybenzoate polyprenyltransferase [Deltaproteobacteria bacterium]